MTITLSPDQERAIREAIRAGQISSVEELIDRAITDLVRQDHATREGFSTGSSVFEQGLGLFSAPEDSALLDEVVCIAYEERHRPTKREL